MSATASNTNASAGTSASTNENANSGTTTTTATPLRQLNSSLDLIFASPRWAKTIDAQHQAAARGDPIPVPHTMVNPSLFLIGHPGHAQPPSFHMPSPQPRRLLPPAWLHGPPPSSFSFASSTSRQPLRSQPSVAASAALPPPPPRSAHPPAVATQAPAPAPPVFQLHRRNDPTPLPPPRRRRQHGQDEDQQSPPSPTILPTIRASARAAAGDLGTRARHRSAHALAAAAAAAEPSASETSHQDSEDEDDDDQQATVRRPTHPRPRQVVRDPPRLVSAATSMTPHRHLPQQQFSLHRAPTPLLPTDGLDDAGDGDHNHTGRMTRSRARQLQQRQLADILLSQLQPVFSIATSLLTVLFSTVLSFLSFSITRPIRWLSHRTGPLFTFSLLFVLVLLLLSWALDPDTPDMPPPRPAADPIPTMTLDALAQRVADMEQATMQLVYRQDAAEAADAAHQVQTHAQVSKDVADLASKRVSHAVDASMTLAVNAAVDKVLDHVHQLALNVSEMTSEVGNLTLRIEQHNPQLPSSEVDPPRNTDDPPLTVQPDGAPAPPLVDYASFASGARAHPHHSSPTHTFPMHPRAVIGGWFPASAIPWFLRPGVPAHGHNWALHPDMQLGSCWATPMGAGGRGAAKLTIKLARPVRPRAVAVSHVLSRAVRKGNARGEDAPRDLRVYGRRVRDGEWYMLAKGEYRIRDEEEAQAQVDERQVFETIGGKGQAEDADEVVDQVRFVFERNWGRKEYTCVYRVEVLAPAPPVDVKGGDEETAANQSGNGQVESMPTAGGAQ